MRSIMLQTLLQVVSSQSSGICLENDAVRSNRYRIDFDEQSQIDRSARRFIDRVTAAVTGDVEEKTNFGLTVASRGEWST
jgi:hypothetical protein